MSKALSMSEEIGLRYFSMFHFLLTKQRVAEDVTPLIYLKWEIDSLRQAVTHPTFWE